ncbi:FHA domain-containing protein, putative [Plasmodium chabaudi chabaudi]|uniref:FHA domain-containing protein, putative n=1 Tax=Plasmodium chabaudi chabaudi TaxID=31271 RepID=A0A4V0KD45_PLACU|nr:FHA domain-containing protein, putative [Plasmodium chabaudi chabaudi]VTZ70758.1 FHA domain-containing protein, putative [Plasmodium chabaudi chabaudi]|eukprot:XP_016654831.1 fork head domain protein, putative [Plasmodium chabaudi chabaudi]
MHKDNIRSSNSIESEKISGDEQSKKMNKSESYDSDSNKSKKSTLSESSSEGEIKNNNLKKKKKSYNNRKHSYDKREISRERISRIDRKKKRDRSIEYSKKYNNNRLNKHSRDSSYSDESSDSRSIGKRYSNNSSSDSDYSEHKKRRVRRKHSNSKEREKDNNSDYEHWNDRRDKNKKEKRDVEKINIRDRHEREMKGKYDYKYKRFEKENRSKNNYKDRSRSKNRYNNFYDDNKKREKDSKHKYRKYDDNTSKHDKRKTDRYDNSSDEYARKEKKKSFKDSNERNRDRDDKHQSNHSNDEYYENNNNNSKNDKEIEKLDEEKNITSDNNVREGQNFNPSGLLAQSKDYKNGVELKYTESIDSEMPDKKWRLYVFLNTATEEPHEILRIHEKPYYLIGKDELVADIILRNMSISKQHAVIQFKKHENKILPFLIDLNSTNGSYLNNEKIDPNKFYELRETDLLRFGSSGREYVLLYDSYEAPTNE